MAVVYSPESGYAKERRAWEAHHTQFGPPGRPYTFQEYPARMYRVTRKSDGTRTHEGQTATDAEDQRRWESRGFVAGGIEAAYAAADRDDQYIGKLAAERAYDVAHGKLSERAAAEVAAHEAAAGARHLADIPETPVRRKPGPKPKTEVVS